MKTIALCFLCWQCLPMARPQNGADFAPSFASIFLDTKTNSNMRNKVHNPRSDGFMDRSYDQFQKDISSLKSYFDYKEASVVNYGPSMNNQLTINQQPSRAKQTFTRPNTQTLRQGKAPFTAFKITSSSTMLPKSTNV